MGWLFLKGWGCIMHPVFLRPAAFIAAFFGFVCRARRLV
jgi:hypothetical protein